MRRRAPSPQCKPSNHNQWLQSLWNTGKETGRQVGTSAPSQRGVSDRLSNMGCEKDLRSDDDLSLDEAFFNLDAIVALNAQCDVHV